MKQKVLTFLDIEKSISSGQSGQMSFDDFFTAFWVFLSNASQRQLNVFYKHFNRYPSPNFANCYELVMQSITGLSDYSIYKTS